MLPKQIKIGNMTYEVRQNDAEDKLMEAGNCLGEIFYNDVFIRVSTKADPQRQIDVLMHEITHGIMHEANLTDIRQDEKATQAIANVLVQMLRENDFGWIRGKCDGTEPGEQGVE